MIIVGIGVGVPIGTDTGLRRILVGRRFGYELTIRRDFQASAAFGVKPQVKELARKLVAIS